MRRSIFVSHLSRRCIILTWFFFYSDAKFFITVNYHSIGNRDGNQIFVDAFLEVSRTDNRLDVC
jgi:hypothetical protein